MKDPILQSVPMPIRSDRLLLRPPHPGDGPKVAEAIRESLTELKAWMPWAQTAPEDDDTEINNRHALLKFLSREDMRLCIWDAKGERFIGSTGLHRIDWSAAQFELGYWCRTSETGKGYITEATQALTRYAFDALKARRVEIRCDADNHRSSSVARRCHYRLDAEIPDYSLKIDGVTPRTEMIFSRLNAEGLPKVRWGQDWY